MGSKRLHFVHVAVNNVTHSVDVFTWVSCQSEGVPRLTLVRDRICRFGASP